MAATALFINRTDLVRNSILDGNVDTDKFIQFVKLAQEIHVQQYMGTELYNEIAGLISDGTIDDVGNAKFKTLLNDYIAPMLIWFAQVDYIPFAAYQMQNGMLGDLLIIWLLIKVVFQRILAIVIMI